MIHRIDDWQKYMQAALECGWPLAILVQIREKTQIEIQHGADQATPSIQRETNYVEQDESEEIENQNMRHRALLMRERGYIALWTRWRQKTKPQWRWKNMRAHLMTSSTHCQKSGRSMILAIMSQKTYEIRRRTKSSVHENPL